MRLYCVPTKSVDAVRMLFLCLFLFLLSFHDVNVDAYTFNIPIPRSQSLSLLPSRRSTSQSPYTSTSTSTYTSTLTSMTLKSQAEPQSTSQSQELVIQELKQSQSEIDILIQNWFIQEARILGTSRMCLSTTKKSIGGRGMFWIGSEPQRVPETETGTATATATKTDESNSIYQGEILALIPSNCVITTSNIAKQFPELNMECQDKGKGAGTGTGKGADKDIDTDKNKDNRKASWQAEMITMAMHCLNNSDRDVMDRRPWITSWKGGGPSCPRPSEDYSMEELDQLLEMVMMGSESESESESESNSKCTIEKLKEAIDARYKTFMGEYENMKNKKKDSNSNHNPLDIHTNKTTIGDMYSIAVSRTAGLGPMWDNQRGIIPVHDFLNHPPPSQPLSLPSPSDRNGNGNEYNDNSNVQLFCFGDLRKMIGFVHANELVKQMRLSSRASSSSSSSSSRAGTSSSSNNRQKSYHYYEPNDRDVLLVASRKIDVGEELWLSYRSSSRTIELIEEKLWLMLQYGFPLHHT